MCQSTVKLLLSLFSSFIVYQNCFCIREKSNLCVQQLVLYTPKEMMYQFQVHVQMNQWACHEDIDPLGYIRAYSTRAEYKQHKVQKPDQARNFLEDSSSYCSLCNLIQLLKEGQLNFFAKILYVHCVFSKIIIYHELLQLMPRPLKCLFQFTEVLEE